MSFANLRGRIAAFGCGLSVILAIHFSPAGADEGPAGADNSGPRPRIGLVLAGGGAKGGAHVGVLKVLEELHVPVDCIAGTSMGALVGAGYAAGLPAADLEEFLRGIDWEAVVGGIGRRPLEPIAQKRIVMAASSGVDLGVKDGHIVTPSGLTNTSGIDDLLRTYVARARMVSDFDKLPIPYRAVATDMVTGRMVVLDHGDLAMAMRASMAIPGAFAPVVWDKYILADGGQVRNIPVDVARQTCAEVVIVVNLVEPETPPEKLVEATQLLARSMDVMLTANEITQLETLTDRDVRVDVEMGDIGTADFTRVPETIPLGEVAARKVADRLAAYAVPEPEYVAWRDRVTMRQDVEARVADRLEEDGLRPAVDGLAERLRTCAVDEAGRDPQLRQGVREQVVGAAVEARAADDVVTGPGQVEDGQRLGGLAGRDAHRADAAFEGGDPLLEHAGRGVHDPGVDVAELFEREEPAGVRRVVEDVARGRVDRNGPGVRRRIRYLAGVKGECLRAGRASSGIECHVGCSSGGWSAKWMSSASRGPAQRGAGSIADPVGGRRRRRVVSEERKSRRSDAVGSAAPGPIWVPPG